MMIDHEKQFDYAKLVDSSIDTDIINLLNEVYFLLGKKISYSSFDSNKFKRLKEIAIIESAEASNSIENIRTTHERLEGLLKNKVRPKNRNEMEILGYSELLQIVHNAYEEIKISKNYILYLHKVLFSFSSKQGSHLKISNNQISEVDGDGNIIRVRFKTVSAALTPLYLEEICESLNHYIEINKPSLIVIPIFILDFLFIHPFNDGNGRISKILTSLLLYKFGFQVSKYVALEKIIENSKSGYYDSLAIYSVNWNERKNDYKPFIKYFLHTIVKAYRILIEKASNLEPKVKKENAFEKILKIFKDNLGPLSKSDLINQCIDLSQSTIELTLRKLLKNSKIIKISKNKGAKYIYTDYFYR